MSDIEIALVVPNEQLEAKAIERFDVQVPGADRGWLERGVIKGIYKTTCVKINGVDSYCLFWHVTSQNVLHVNAAISLISHDDFSGLLNGVKRLAEIQKCRGVEIITRRRGLVIKAQNRGADTIGVSLFLPVA